MGKSKKKTFVKIAPSELKLGPPDPEANALPTELGRRSAGQEISEVSFVCFMHHFTCWTFLEINRA